MSAPGEALKAAGKTAKKTKAQRDLLNRLFVEDSWHTGEQLAQMERQRKADFYEREQRRAAA